MRTTLLIPAVAAVMMLTTACSQDRTVYDSTVHLPLTLEVVDTLNDTTLWTMDVPVDHKIAIDFGYENSAPEMFKKPEAHPDRMKWWLYPGHSQSNYGMLHSGSVDSGEVDLPGVPIMIKQSYRQVGRDAAQAPSLTSDDQAAAAPPIRLELNVYEDGSFDFDGERRTTEELGPLFQSLYGKRRIIITGTPGTPRENLLALQRQAKDQERVTVVIPADEAESAVESQDEVMDAEPAAEQQEAATPEVMTENESSEAVEDLEEAMEEGK